MGYAIYEVATETYGSTSGSGPVRARSGPARGRSEFRPGPSGEAPDARALEDAVEDLGDEIATLAARIHAATHRFLELIARFDRLGGWQPGGHRNCACWLAYRTGLDAGTAREHVRVARALEDLPGTSAAMAAGELSYSQVRALTRVADADTEADLLELAAGCPASQLERLVRAYRMGTRRDEAERERHASRTLSVFPDLDGMVVVRGLLEPEVGALLMRAIEAASDALYRDGRGEGDGADARDSDREAARRRADALGLLAERALEAGLSPRAGAVRGAGSAGASEIGDRATAPAPVSGTRAARYQVVLHVEPGTLQSPGEDGPDESAGESHLDDGTRVSAETSRRISCDASVVRVSHGSDGSVLDVGRRSRTIPPALRRALEVRDRGCRFPGCGLRFTDAHHIVHWADGGETSLENTVLLCRAHHRLMHEGGWVAESWGKGRTAFRDPRGSVHHEAGWTDGRQLEDDVLEAFMAMSESAGRGPTTRPPSPGPWTASARWRRHRDIPLDVLCRAREALL